MKHERRNKRIKRLQREAKMQREKRRAADTEIIYLRKSMSEFVKSMVNDAGQISMILDSWLGRIAQEHGEHEKDGRWVLAVDSFSPSEFMERYDVSAVKDEDTGKYIVTVEERNAEN